MKPLDTWMIRAAIAFSISVCGIDGLADSDRFIAAIKDFKFPDSHEVEKNLLIFVIRIGMGEALLDLVDRPYDEKGKGIMTSLKYLTNEFCLSEERSKEILSAFDLIIGWDDLPWHVSHEPIKIQLQDAM